MMFSHPYFHLPYYNRYSRYGYNYCNYNPCINKDLKKQESKNNIPMNTIYNETRKEEPSLNSDDSPLFQIFGINLYFDDILIICLIFFLYQEGVKDESLFIALVLLLLS